MGRRPIWLVGMMGAGKSAVGPLLAQRMDRRFVDSDHEIERSAGMSVSEIFSTEGERAFRDRERQVVGELSSGTDVVALGGGTIAQPGAAALLQRTGTVVYLKASAGALLDRLGDCSDRPLLHGLSAEERLAALESLLAERASAYESASIEVDTEGRTLESVVEEIRLRLDSARSGREGGVEKGVRV
ncbi:MAG: shikimate kinase [Deltaproteobacteria bacterium]|jgi:3-dehydroquinate synthase|nr:shikimate kinase [Deltaproteobacteria bacterium]